MDTLPGNNAVRDCEVLLLTVIVDRGGGSRVLRVAREAGISGGTILLGHGTYGRGGLEWFDDYESRKEIVLMIGYADILMAGIDRISRVMRLDRPNHGIAFTMPVASLTGSTSCHIGPGTREGESDMKRQAIFAIVDKGYAETVVEAAEKAGARGATVVNARGAGIHETARLFSMEIEPEKEIVLILAETALCGAITDAVQAAIGLDEPGRGILFSLDVRQAYGLVGQQTD